MEEGMEEGGLGFRRHHIGRALGRVFWLFEERVLAELRAAGFDDVHHADLSVIRLLPLAGARVTELAERGRMSKQGMGKLVAGAERRELVARAPDPKDGRAQIVQLTQRGRALLLEGGRVMAALEAEWGDVVGEAELEQARRTLLRLADAIGPADYL